jgi:hypothetical protein
VVHSDPRQRLHLEVVWRFRFVQDGLAKLGEVRTGRGPKPSITPQQVEQIVHDTLHSKPKGKRIGVQGRWPTTPG